MKALKKIDNYYKSLILILDQNMKNFYENSKLTISKLNCTINMLKINIDNLKTTSIMSFSKDILEIVDILKSILIMSFDINSFKLGLILLEKIFEKILYKNNIKEINPIGLMFNPNYHQSISHTLEKKVPKGIITKVLQVGYLLKNKILRPALVEISK